MEILIALAVVLGIMLIQAITMVSVVILYAKLKGDCFSINKPWEDARPIHKPLFEFNNFKRSEPKETEEEKRLRILNENIENYDGSGKGQQKL